jgi:hypothetical protein
VFDSDILTFQLTSPTYPEPGGELSVWETATWHCVYMNRKRSKAGVSGRVKFSPDGNLLAVVVRSENQTLNLRRSTTNHKPQTTDHRPQTTGHRPQTTDHRPQTTDHRPYTLNHKFENPKPINHKPQTTNYKPQTTNSQFSSGHRE